MKTSSSSGAQKMETQKDESELALTKMCSKISNDHVCLVC